MVASVRMFAMAVALPALLVGGVSLAGPAPQDEPSEAPSEAPGGNDVTVDMGAVRSAQSRLEDSMAKLGEMAQRAKQGGDATMASCLEDKVTRGNDIMATATPELMVLRDSTASAQSKAFAAEKLDAAADAMDGVMSSAKRCSGEQELDSEDNVTTNEVDKTETIPVQDPTIAPTKPNVPPAVDDAQPPSVASPSI